MINESIIDNKNIDKQEELAELLRALSRPSKIASEDEYKKLVERAKNLIAEGYMDDNMLEVFLDKEKYN